MVFIDGPEKNGAKRHICGFSRRYSWRTSPALAHRITLAKWAIIDTKTKKIIFKKTKFDSTSLVKKINNYDPNNKKLIKYFLR